MDINNFLELGLSLMESKIYLNLIKKTSSDAKTIIKETGMHKKIVYDNLDRLIHKGLVSSIIINGKNIYRTTGTDAFEEIILEEQKNLSKKKELVNEINKNLKNLKKTKTENYEATLYQGIKGIRLILIQLTKIPDDYIAFGSPKEAHDTMGETFWKNFQAKLDVLNTTQKVIFNESLRQYSHYFKESKSLKIKYFPLIEPLTETIVVGDMTVIIIWTSNPIATVIKNKQVADSYKKFFKILWSNAIK